MVKMMFHLKDAQFCHDGHMNYLTTPSDFIQYVITYLIKNKFHPLYTIKDAWGERRYSPSLS
jgi:hypothetical protein